MKPLRYTVSAGPGEAETSPAMQRAPGAVNKVAAARHRPASDVLDRIERQPEVGNEIARILDADRNSDERIVDPDAIAGFLGQSGMRGARGMRYQTLRAAETDCELDDLKSIEQAKRLR